jgi:hypothetical protein
MTRHDRQMHRALMRIEDAHSRLERVLLKGEVVEVKGDRVRLRLREADPANGKEFLSPLVHWQGQAGSEAGGFSLSVRPAVGEKMALLSPSGDIGPASLAIPDSWSDDAPNPDAGADMVLKRGDKTFIMDGDGIRLMVGGTGVAVTADEVRTVGRTRLNNGTKKVHRKDDQDSAGDVATEGADDVFA